MNKPYHLFISYATENEDYTSKLASHFQYLGLSVWFAPLTLKVGSKLLDSINAGLMASQYGLLILSPEYITKQWTTYEVDVLHRQHIEKDKKLFPIWHGVDKAKVDQWNLGISGIIALKSSENIESFPKRLLTSFMKELRCAALRQVMKIHNGDSCRGAESCMLIAKMEVCLIYSKLSSSLINTFLYMLMIVSILEKS